MNNTGSESGERDWNDTETVSMTGRNDMRDVTFGGCFSYLQGLETKPRNGFDLNRTIKL